MFCQSLEDCTHFVWNPYENNACILKKGNVLKVNAIYKICKRYFNIFILIYPLITTATIKNVKTNLCRGISTF